MLKLSRLQNLNQPSPYRNCQVSHCFHPLSYYSELYIPETMYDPDYIIRTASVSFAPHTKRVSNVLDGGKSKIMFLHFFDCIKCIYTLCKHCLPINTLQTLHNFSHHPILLFLSFYHGFPSLVFHRKKPLWSFSGIVWTVNGDETSPLPCLPSSSQATGMSYGFPVLGLLED